jgi:cyclic pyranopterin phosphate synthase
MPTKNNHLNWEKHFLSEREIIERIKILGDILLIKKDRVSSPNTKYFKIDGFRGIYGIISPLSSPFCNMCNRIRLNAKGDLILCLGWKDSLNLKEILRKKELNIEKILKEFIFKKPKGHRLNLSNLPFIMCEIGG